MPQTTALSVKAMMVLVAKHTLVTDKVTVETWVQVHQVWCVGMSIPAVCHWSRCSAGKRAVEWHYESVTEPSWGFMTVKPSARGVASVVLISGLMLLTKLGKVVTHTVKLSDAPRSVLPKPVLEDPLPCIFCMSPLSNTPDSTHQLVSRDCKN